MANIPLMNFPIVNPMGGALDRAGSTYSGVNQNITRQLQNQKERQMMPFYLEEAELNNKLNQYKVQEAEMMAPYLPQLTEQKIQKGMYDFQKKLVDLQQAKLELSMYPENQGSLNRYRDALSGVSELKMQYPELLAGGKAAEIRGLQGFGQSSGQIPGQQSGQFPGQPQQNFGGPQGTPSYPGQQQNYGAPQGYQDIDPADRARQVQLETLGKSPGEIKMEEAVPAQQVKSYAKRMEILDDAASTAQMKNTTLEAINRAYLDVPEIQKGNLLGIVKAVGGDARMVEAMESGLVLAELDKMKGTASDPDREYIQAKYGGRKLNNSDKQELSLIWTLMNKREIEKQRFFADRQNQNPHQIESEWNKEIAKKSIFKEPEFLKFEANKKVSGMSDEDAEAYMNNLMVKERYNGINP